MTNYALEITLESPLTSADGEGRIGLVDRDVAFDDMGLPILPGRRLKGLWREAYRDVIDAWQQCGQSAIPVEQIFGDTGQSPGSGDACIQIANAELKGVSCLKEWLQYLQHHKIQRLHTDDVVHHYATVRTQTAIDRETGSAKENTLRLTRTLRAGLVFWAPVYFFVPSPDSGLKNALALGAASLRYMGTARTRGLGKVRCRLLELDQSGQSTDLTPTLNQNVLPSITSAASRSVRSTVVPTGTGVSSHLGTPTHLLRYQLTLTAAAVIPVSDGDPNTVVTRRDIPGSHILGAAAWHYLNQANHTPADPDFRRAFLKGGLRFLTAYPEAVDTQQRLIPIPHSMRKFKDTESLIDFVVQTPGNVPTKRLDRQYAKIGNESLETQSVKIERNYHHARASKDRRIGRALGAQVAGGGALFTYEAIQAGQSFQGAILGSECDLTSLKTWLHDLTSVSIGRSRSAQYGKADFKWIDGVPQPLSEITEWEGFNVGQAVATSDKLLIITTLSPLLTVNDKGHPEPRFPKQELAAALGMNASDLTLSASYTRTEIIGGYHSHLRLPRQQWPAIAPGSVFVFEVSQSLDEIGENRLIKLEHDGLGLRKGEGHGRIAVNRHGHFDLAAENQLDNPEDTFMPDPPVSDISEDITELMRSVIRTRCITEILEAAGIVAGQIENIPSNSLLGRLRLLLQQPPDVAVGRLNSLRKQAKDTLTNCRIRTERLTISELPNTLYAVFEQAWTHPNTLTERLIETQATKLLEDGDADDTRQTLINQLVANDSKQICKMFLDQLLTVLYRR